MKNYSFKTEFRQAACSLFVIVVIFGFLTSSPVRAVSNSDVECVETGQKVDFRLMPYSVANPARSDSNEKSTDAAVSFQEDQIPCEQVSLPDRVASQKDVRYGLYPAQIMDVYLPPTSVNAPVIFMVHGGGWSKGDKASAGFIKNKIARWVPQGFIVISANYRLIPEAHPLEQAQDIAKAVAFAQRHAEYWGADPSRFLLLGHSAGAHLVALVASDAATAAREDLRPALGSILLDSAALDVPRIMRAPHLKLYDEAFGNSPLYWRAASPLHQLSGIPQPMLIICSTLREVSCEQGQSFSAQVSEHRSRAEVAPFDLTHQEINVQLGLDGEYTNRVEAFMHTLGL